MVALEVDFSGTYGLDVGNGHAFEAQNAIPPPPAAGLVCWLLCRTPALFSCCAARRICNASR